MYEDTSDFQSAEDPATKHASEEEIPQFANTTFGAAEGSRGVDTAKNNSEDGIFDFQSDADDTSLDEDLSSSRSDTDPDHSRLREDYEAFTNVRYRPHPQSGRMTIPRLCEFRQSCRGNAKLKGATQFLEHWKACHDYLCILRYSVDRALTIDRASNCTIGFTTQTMEAEKSLFDAQTLTTLGSDGTSY